MSDNLRAECLCLFRFLQSISLSEALERIPDVKPGELGTCAIVGVADNLKGKGWGKQIDAHDFVARYSAKLKGFEKDVGSKVDALLVKEVLINSKSGKHTRYDEKIYPSRYVVTRLEKDLPLYRNPITDKKYPRITFGPDLRAKWRPTAGQIYYKYMDSAKIKVRPRRIPSCLVVVVLLG